MSAHPHPRLTPEQYLSTERTAEFKSEYYAGETFAMAGGTYEHGVIISNFASELHGRLKESPCSVTVSEVRVRVAPDGLYTYPDIMVVCGDPCFIDDRKDTVTNPVLIVEVLSRSTEASDRGFKFAQYRAIETLQEYVLVSQAEPRVEVFRRQAEGQWLLTEFLGVNVSCRLTSLDCEVPLAGIYAKVTFKPESPVPAA
jgi:Uma2 family endonuclease